MPKNSQRLEIKVERKILGLFAAIYPCLINWITILMVSEMLEDGFGGIWKLRLGLKAF